MALVSSQGLGVPLVTALAQVKQATQDGLGLRFPTPNRAPQGQPCKDTQPLPHRLIHPVAGPIAEDLGGVQGHPVWKVDSSSRMVFPCSWSSTMTITAALWFPINVSSENRSDQHLQSLERRRGR